MVDATVASHRSRFWRVVPALHGVLHTLLEHFHSVGRRCIMTVLATGRLYGENNCRSVYGCGVTQGQPWLSQGTLDVLVILFGIRTCILDVLVILFGIFNRLMNN